MRTPAGSTAEHNPSMLTYPDWVVLHVPHDSVEVPAAVRSQFCSTTPRWLKNSGA